MTDPQDAEALIRRWLERAQRNDEQSGECYREFDVASGDHFDGRANIYRACAHELSAAALSGGARPQPDQERVKKLARTFAQEWLRPNDPDAATSALVDTLQTVMLAFFACASQAAGARPPEPADKWVVVVGKGSWAKCHGPFATYDDCIDWAKRNQFTEKDSYQAYPINAALTGESR